jgi:predicted HicB family RNase H-like nuclease
MVFEIEIEDELLARATQAAQAQGISLSKFMEHGLMLWLEERNKRIETDKLAQ